MAKSMLPNGQHYYLTRELLAYLGRHAIVAGMTFQPLDGTPLRIDRPEDVSVDLKWSMQGVPCLLVVRSKIYANAEHFVFWDGEAVRDSSGPDDTNRLGDYEIIDIMPLTYYDDESEACGQELLEIREVSNVSQ